MKFEEIMEKINEKYSSARYIHPHRLKEILEEEIFYIKDVSENFPDYGLYFIKSQNGYMLFPVGEEGYIRIDSIQMMDERYAKLLEDTIKEYKKEMEYIKEGIQHMETLIHSQRLRRLFK